MMIKNMCDLKPNEVKILRVLQKNRELTNNELALRTKINSKNISRYIKMLFNKDLLYIFPTQKGKIRSNVNRITIKGRKIDLSDIHKGKGNFEVSNKVKNIVDKKLEKYELIITVEVESKIKAKECINYALEGLNNKNIWYSRKYEVKKVN